MSGKELRDDHLLKIINSLQLWGDMKEKFYIHLYYKAGPNRTHEYNRMNSDLKERYYD